MLTSFLSILQGVFSTPLYQYCVTIYRSKWKCVVGRSSASFRDCPIYDAVNAPNTRGEPPSLCWSRLDRPCSLPFVAFLPLEFCLSVQPCEVRLPSDRHGPWEAGKSASTFTSKSFISTTSAAAIPNNVQLPKLHRERKDTA